MSQGALDRPTFEAIEAYVLHRMSAAERLAFEQRLANDAVLRAEVKLERENIRAIELGGITRTLRDIAAEEHRGKRAGGRAGYLKYAAAIAVLVVGGVGMLLWTVYLFDRVGKGTLGVGDVMGQPVHLVVRGPYRHVRNPMIAGVFAILLGEAAIAASGWLLLWFAIFFAMLTTVIKFWEEPHLT